MSSRDSSGSATPNAHAERRLRRARRAARRARLFGLVVRPLRAFLRVEAASGVLLLLTAAVALAWANSDPVGYEAAFELRFGLGVGAASASFSLRELINDGLMTIFFFVVGMEIKRELAQGELDSLRKAALPAFAALGGMLVPAAVYLAFNWRGDGRHGWGIPMATDIAFCVGVLTLLKSRVPRSLVVFITALAIFDDIGGILVIAIFYGHGITASALGLAFALTLLLYAMNHAEVTSGLAYALVGATLWNAFHHAGIHPTIAGVVTGLMIPACTARKARDVLSELAEHARELAERPADEELDAASISDVEAKLESVQAPLTRLVHGLHPLVAFFIMPVFALANSGVPVRAMGLGGLLTDVALGTALGLFLGKQLGVFATTYLGVKLGLSPMPRRASLTQLFGTSVMSGIGFTVALFIASLAFASSPERLNEAKLGILAGSLIAGVVGFAILRLNPAPAPELGNQRRDASVAPTRRRARARWR